MRQKRIVAAGAAAAVATALLSLASGPSQATAVGRSPDGLVLTATRHSLLATHRHYQQTFHGLPVLHGYYVTHTDASGHVTVDDGRLPVPDSLELAPDVSASIARTSARRALTAADPGASSAKGSAAATVGSKQRSVLAVTGGRDARLVWQVVDTGASGSSESIVDASTGAVVAERSLVKSARGHGRVFNPNPVVALHNENLTDQGDANETVLNPAYKTVTLTNLDASGTLHGTYARIMNDDVARSTNGAFLYKRHDDRFEQVSAYYDITHAQAYLRSLGFTNVNNDAQMVDTDGIPDDNSFYDPETDMITFGSGGVDDAEDEEVVWHELGHAIQDSQVPGFGVSEQAGAIGEGFGDYWAVTMSQPVSHRFDLPCVADWDATSYTSGARHCLRRIDGTKTTADIDGEVHDDGEIWSRALWSIHGTLGRARADKVIIESQFSYLPDTSFAQAAQSTVRTAKLLYGANAGTKVRKAFTARRILS